MYVVVDSIVERFAEFSAHFHATIEYFLLADGRLYRFDCVSSALVVSIYVFHAVGRGFESQPGHTKDHHTDCTNCSNAGIRVRVWPKCSRTVLVCRTVYGEMHYKDTIRSIVRVKYCIPVTGVYVVLHGR